MQFETARGTSFFGGKKFLKKCLKIRHEFARLYRGVQTPLNAHDCNSDVAWGARLHLFICSFTLSHRDDQKGQQVRRKWRRFNRFMRDTAAVLSNRGHAWVGTRSETGWRRQRRRERNGGGGGACSAPANRTDARRAVRPGPVFTTYRRSSGRAESSTEIYWNERAGIGVATGHDVVGRPNGCACTPNVWTSPDGMCTVETRAIWRKRRDRQFDSVR